MDSESQKVGDFQVDLMDPVNRNHPLNRGLMAWYLALPGKTGGRYFYDLLGKYPGVLTASGSGSTAWKGTARPGGRAEFYSSNNGNYFTLTGFTGFLGNQARTSCGWMRATSSSGVYNVLMDQGRASGSSNLPRWLIFTYASSGYPSVELYGDGLVGNINVCDGAWHHIAGVYDQSHIYLYVDGILNASKTGGNLATEGGAILLAGVDHTSNGTIVGSVDDIRYFNYAMSASQVWSLYKNSMAGCPGLLNEDEVIEGDGFGWPSSSQFTVTATNNFYVGATAPTPVHDRVVGVTSGWLFTATAPAPAFNHTYTASSSSSFQFTGTATESYGLGIGVAASSRFTFSPSSTQVRDLHRAATSGLTLTTSASEFVGHSLPVSASSGFVLATPASGQDTQNFPVSATSGLELTGSGSKVLSHGLLVSASNNIAFTAASHETPNRAWSVSATSQVTLTTTDTSSFADGNNHWYSYNGHYYLNYPAVISEDYGANPVARFWYAWALAETHGSTAFGIFDYVNPTFALDLTYSGSGITYCQGRNFPNGNGAALFNGGSASVAWPTPTVGDFGNGGPFTIEAWFQTSDYTQASQTIFSLGDGTANGVNLQINQGGATSDGTLSVVLPTVSNLSTGHQVSDNNLHYVLMQSGDDGISVYLDNALIYTSGSVSPVWPMTKLIIGSDGAGNNFHGKVGFVALYDGRAMVDASGDPAFGLVRVANHYNAGFVDGYHNSASSVVHVGSSSGIPRTYTAAGSSGFVFSRAESHTISHTFFATAASALGLGSAAYGLDTRNLAVAASSGFSFHLAAHDGVSHSFPVSAASTFTAGSTTERFGPHVAAASGLRFQVVGDRFGFQVAAASAFTMHAGVIREYDVAAASSVNLTIGLGLTRNLSATSSFTMTPGANRPGNLGGKKLYLTAAPPSYYPANFLGNWTETTDALFRALSFEKGGDASVLLSNSRTPAFFGKSDQTCFGPVSYLQTPTDGLLYAGVSEPLTAQVISGTITPVLALTASTFADSYLRVYAYLIPEHSEIKRGILIDTYIDATNLKGANPVNPEFAALSPTTLTFAPIRLIPQAAQDGDQIVVEIGFHSDGESNDFWVGTGLYFGTTDGAITSSSGITPGNILSDAPDSGSGHGATYLEFSNPSTIVGSTGPITYQVSATSILTYTDTATLATALQRYVAAADTFNLGAVAQYPLFSRAYEVLASDTLSVGDSASQGATRLFDVAGMSILRMSDLAQVAMNRTISVAASSTLALVVNGSANGELGASAKSAVQFGSLASIGRELSRVAASTLSISVALFGGRDISVSAITAVSFNAGEETNDFLATVAQNGLVTHVAASSAIGLPVAGDTILFTGRADAAVQLPSGDIVFGGDANAGLRTILMTGISGSFPMSYAETPGGLLLLANGVDPMIRWSGLGGSAIAAGVTPPAAPIRLAGSGVGAIAGMRRAYCRFLDADSNPSNLSPVSNLVNMGRERAIDSVDFDTSTGVVTIWSDEHGLKTGEAIVISGVNGLPVVNGTRTVTVLDPDHFTLVGVQVRTGQWIGGGTWTWGIAQVVYQGLQVATDPKIVRRQVLRNLEGTLDTLYVDIDTADLTSTTLSSTRTDEDLATSEAVPLFGTDDIPFANRYGVPPSHKSVVVSHLGRIFAAVDVAYAEGCVLPRLGSPYVRGIGTAWQASFAGRFLYVNGASQAQEIASVDPVGQVITLAAPYAGATQPFASYVIRPAPAERKLIYYSEPAPVEAWPAWNALALPEDSDEITGLYSKDGALYAVEGRHIYRIAYDGEPARGIQTMATRRGALTNRVIVEVEGSVLMLDEVGIHEFDGQESQSISDPIQAVFQADGQVVDLQLDWSADRTLWHGAHDPVRNTVRWFVTMVGQAPLVHAVCYHYRAKRWWIEQYATPITSSTLGTVGYRRSLVGTSARRVLVLSEGTLDLAPTGATLRGTVTSATTTTLVDSTAAFASSLAGVPVTIAEGTGRGQTRTIASNTSTSLEVVLPWTTTPDATSVYQVGGVPWTWRSGWFDVSPDEEENPRDVEVVYQPTADPATIDLELYFDHEDTPRIWGYDREADGVVCVSNQSVIAIGTQPLAQRRGYAIQRFSGHSDTYGYRGQFVSVMLSGVQATQSIRVFQVNINGASGVNQ